MANLDHNLKKKLKEQYSIDISVRKMMEFVRAHNNYQRSLRGAVEYLYENTDEFYEFILERTDIPLYGKSSSN